MKLTGKERDDKLNAAFDKLTAATVAYRARMSLVRQKLKTVNECLNASLRNQLGLQKKALVLGRDASKELLAEIDSEKAQVAAYRVEMEKHVQEMTDADAARIQEIATVNAEIEALGGNLNLTKVPA